MAKIIRNRVGYYCGSSRSSVIFVLVGFIILAGLLAGCSNRADDEFSAATPALIQIAVDGRGAQCSGCEQNVHGMCSLARTGDGLVLGVLLDYEIDESPCEERRYPRRQHADATIGIVDSMTGLNLVGSVEMLDIGLVINAGAKTEVGDAALLNVRRFDGQWLIVNARRVDLDEEVDLEVDPYAQSTLRYDLPTDFGEFVEEANFIWDNFGDQCEEERHYPSEEELIEFYAASDCPDYSEQNNYDQNNPEDPFDHNADG